MFLITLICVYVIDITKFPDSIKTGLGRLIDKKPEVIRIKPFDCSLCSSFWVSLIYLIYNNKVTLGYIALALTFAVLTQNIAEAVYIVRDWITKIQQKIS